MRVHKRGKRNQLAGARFRKKPGTKRALGAAVRGGGEQPLALTQPRAPSRPPRASRGAAEQGRGRPGRLREGDSLAPSLPTALTSFSDAFSPTPSSPYRSSCSRSLSTAILERPASPRAAARPALPAGKCSLPPAASLLSALRGAHEPAYMYQNAPRRRAALPLPESTGGREACWVM